MTVKVSKPAINVREELADLKKPTGIAGQAMLRAETPQEQFQLIGAGRRNLIINGDFQVTQRGDYSSNTGVSQNTYYIDRWKHLVQVVTAQIRRDNGVVIDGKPMSVFRMEATSSATGRMGIRQTVEARGTRCPIEDGPATLSVWMRSTNPNACLLFYQYSGGGYIGHKPYTGRGEWQKLSLTVEASPSALTHSAVSLELNFGIHTAANGNVSITSGDYIEIAQPQLEVGKVATPFEHRSYGEELALCQRYYVHYDLASYQRLAATSYCDINNRTQVDISLPVPLRSYVSAGHTNLTISGQAVNGVNLTQTGSNGNILTGNLTCPGTPLTVGTIYQIYTIGAGNFYVNGEI